MRETRTRDNGNYVPVNSSVLYHLCGGGVVCVCVCVSVCVCV